MSAPEIRPTIEADLPAITAIYQQAVREGTATFEIDPPDLAEMTRRFRTLVDGGYPYFVAILDGRIAGYAYAGAYRPRPVRRLQHSSSRSYARRETSLGDRDVSCGVSVWMAEHVERSLAVPDFEFERLPGLGVADRD